MTSIKSHNSVANLQKMTLYNLDLVNTCTRMMFIKHYAPNRCLCIKVANSIDHWVEDCRDVKKAGGGGICTKNGSYSETEKSQGGGVGGVRVDVNGEVKLLWKFKKKKIGGGGGGRVGGGGGSGWM